MRFMKRKLGAVLLLLASAACSAWDRLPDPAPRLLHWISGRPL